MKDFVHASLTGDGIYYRYRNEKRKQVVVSVNVGEAGPPIAPKAKPLSENQPLAAVPNCGKAGGSQPMGGGWIRVA